MTNPVAFRWTAWACRIEPVGGAAGGGVEADPLLGSVTTGPAVGDVGVGVVLGGGVGVGAGVGIGDGVGVGDGDGPYGGLPLRLGKLESRARP